MKFGNQNLFSCCLQNNLLGLFVLASVLAPSGPFSTGILSPAVPAHEDPLPVGLGCSECKACAASPDSHKGIPQEVKLSCRAISH